MDSMKIKRYLKVKLEHEEKKKTILIELNNHFPDLKLKVFYAKTSNAERVAFRVIHQPLSSPPGSITLLTKLLINKMILPTESTSKWLMNYGEEASKESFGCWPLSLQTKSSLGIKVLENIYLEPVFTLYTYLASLKKKNSFSINNTPKNIKCQLNALEIEEVSEDKNLLDAYLSLSAIGLLVEVGNGLWAHSDSDTAKEAVAVMRQAIAIEKFMYFAERSTIKILSTIEKYNKGGLELISNNASTNFKILCPICHFNFGGNINFSFDEFAAVPFHYNCNTIAQVSTMHFKAKVFPFLQTLNWEGIRFFNGSVYKTILFNDIKKIIRNASDGIYWLNFTIFMKNKEKADVLVSANKRIFGKISIREVNAIFFY